MQLMYWDRVKKKLRITVVDSGGNFDQGIGSIKVGSLEWTSFGNFADGRAVGYKWKPLLATVDILTSTLALWK